MAANIPSLQHGGGRGKVATAATRYPPEYLNQWKATVAQTQAYYKAYQKATAAPQVAKQQGTQTQATQQQATQPSADKLPKKVVHSFMIPSGLGTWALDLKSPPYDKPLPLNAPPPAKTADGSAGSNPAGNSYNKQVTTTQQQQVDQPQASQPQASQPQASQTQAAQQQATQPQATQSQATQPQTAQPHTAQLQTTQSQDTQTQATQQQEAQSQAAQSQAAQPQATQPPVQQTDQPSADNSPKKVVHTFPIPPGTGTWSLPLEHVPVKMPKLVQPVPSQADQVKIPSPAGTKFNDQVRPLPSIYDIRPAPPHEASITITGPNGAQFNVPNGSGTWSTNLGDYSRAQPKPQQTAPDYQTQPQQTTGETAVAHQDTVSTGKSQATTAPAQTLPQTTGSAQVTRPPQPAPAQVGGAAVPSTVASPVTSADVPAQASKSVAPPPTTHVQMANPATARYGS